jgi:F0F1-type ATP synthase membrane subunit b/b'
MAVSLDWILSAAVALIGALVSVIWHTLNKSIDGAAGALREDIDKASVDAHKRFGDVWAHINKLRDDVVEIKESRGSFGADIENIKKRIDEIPNYKEFCEMFRESEKRIDARLDQRVDALSRQIQEIVLTVVRTPDGRAGA